MSEKLDPLVAEAVKNLSANKTLTESTMNDKIQTIQNDIKGWAWEDMVELANDILVRAVRNAKSSGAGPAAAKIDVLIRKLDNILDY